MPTLNHKVYGEGKPLIILHGLFGSLDNWVTLGKKFGEDFKVFLVDQRNHGQSFHDATFSYEAMSEDLCQFMGEMSINSAHLIGHSMGGKTVMEFARKYPEKVDKLVVADIGPKSYPVHHTAIIKAFYSVPINTLKSRKEADEILSTQIEDFGIRQFLLKNLARTENGFKWKMNLDVIATQIEEVGKGLNQNATFKKESLFIRGGKSDYILDGDVNLIHSIFPNSKIATVEGAGHWLHAEKPMDFYQQVRNFLL
ncbi:alpha/beta fold hydrolase [Roseivirga misakiensis]|uniref:Alpha/beta hydrolase n=1 Tax=Roseivirga misakiensis TaxID=1563681 RepID=A0A1E5T654_9BACT|nr:alpha/beta fold hydrolase [Roseivirga misakiensis]OEK06828.1 alpha/beta hydrolase [Roseivirga misakiensis]